MDREPTFIDPTVRLNQLNTLIVVLKVVISGKILSAIGLIVVESAGSEFHAAGRVTVASF